MILFIKKEGGSRWGGDSELGARIGGDSLDFQQLASSPHPFSPPGPVEDKTDTYEALVLANTVSALLNEAPSLYGEEVPLQGVAEPSDAGTPEQDAEQDAVLPFTPSKVAEPSDAGISEEEDNAILVNVSRKVMHCKPVEIKPLVVGDWCSNKDIIAWLDHKCITMKSVSHGHGLRR